MKRDINEKIIKFKIRWCVRKFEQIKNFNYHEIFSTIIKFINYKIIFVIVVANNWEIKQINVKIAFFYGDINEKVYVKISHDYTIKKSIYCRFKKTLYKFKQNSRIWFNIFSIYLKQHEFLFLNVDQNVFFNDQIIIAIYVDDLFIVDFKMKYINNIKKTFHKRF